MDLRDTRRIIRRLPRLRRVAVIGQSMEPKYHDGDWLLVGIGWPTTTGCVLLARDPRARDRLVVKRAIRQEDSGWWVEGDNDERSTDSRQYGLIRNELILGRVLFRYHRPGRILRYHRPGRILRYHRPGRN